MPILNTTIVGEAWQLHPDRCAFLQHQKILFIADLHLGKSDILRSQGIAVPYALQDKDIQRLEALLLLFKPNQLVILGDFLDGNFLLQQTLERWNQLKEQFPAIEFVLVKGNHDRAFDAEQLMMDRVENTLLLGDLVCTHEPLATLPEGAMLNIHGHIHPAFRLPGMRRKIPALVFRKPYLNLPAFSEFTAGVEEKVRADQAWVFLSEEGAVIPIMG